MVVVELDRELEGEAGGRRRVERKDEKRPGPVELGCDVDEDKGPPWELFVMLELLPLLEVRWLLGEDRPGEGDDRGAKVEDPLEA